MTRQGIAGDKTNTRTPKIDAQDFEHLPSVLTSKQAANVLRVGVREVRQLVDAGDLLAARLGPRRVIRIARSAVIALLSGAKAA